MTQADEIDALFEELCETLMRVVEEAGTKVELLYLAVDRVDRWYGGPEDGGWWYDGGSVVASPRPVLIDYTPDNEPYISEGSVRQLRALSEEWVKGFDFSTRNRESARPVGDDYRWRVELSPPEDWSEGSVYH